MGNGFYQNRFARASHGMYAPVLGIQDEEEWVGRVGTPLRLLPVLMEEASA